MLTISPSPHDHGSQSVSKLMYGVIIALLPALLASVYFFGIGSVIITVTAMVSCVVFEWMIQRFLMKQKPSISDGSAMVTGILLAFCLPANLPPGLVILGSFVAISVGKMSFGGLGTIPSTRHWWAGYSCLFHSQYR